MAATDLHFHMRVEQPRECVGNSPAPYRFIVGCTLNEGYEQILDGTDGIKRVITYAQARRIAEAVDEILGGNNVEVAVISTTGEVRKILEAKQKSLTALHKQIEEHDKLLEQIDEASY